MPATVIAERIGWQRGITILKSASSSRDRARQRNVLLIKGALAQSQDSPSLMRGIECISAEQAVLRCHHLMT